jgi:AAA domain-containing protein
MSVAQMDNPTLDRLALRVDRKRLFVLYDDLDANSASKSWLVDKMLGAGEMSAVYGPPGCGKGVIIQDMALHIAARLPWHGRTVMGLAVVYVALERKKLVERRAIAWRNKHGHQGLPFAVVGGAYDFRTPATAQQIAETCRQVEEATGEQVVLLIIDTVSRSLAGGDENSPKDMGALVTTVAQLQERTKAHVLLVHHIPHDSERLRGHGALLGAVDTTISVVNAGTARTAKVVKANDSEEGEGTSFTIEGVEVCSDGTTAAVAVPSVSPIPSVATPKLTANQKTMLALLHDAGPAGLLTEEWNTKAKEAGIGERRRADLTDGRTGLKAKGLVREYMDRWTVART